MTRLFLLFAFLWVLTLSAGPVDDMAPGTWYEAPNTHMREVDPCPQRQTGGGSCSWSGTGGQAMIMKAWGGAAFDDTRDRLIVWGGGHGDYGGNEVYVFDVNALTWTRVTDPSDPPARDTPYASDGAPGSCHSRNTLEYVPALDALCIFGFAGYFPSASVGSHNTDCYSFTSNAWVKKTDVPSGGSARGFTAVDTNGIVWSHGEGQAGKLTRFNPYTNTWTSHATNPWGWMPYAGTAAIDPAAHKLYAPGGGKLLQWDLNNPNTRLVELSTSGSTSIQSPSYPGFVWHPSGNFVAWNGGQSVYVLNPGTRVWTQVTGSGANPGSAQSNGTYGRFRYIPSKDAFIAVNSVDANVFFYKLPASYTRNDAKNLAKRSMDLRLTPNPCRDIADISMPAISGKTLVEIYNVQGKRVFQRQFRLGAAAASWNASPFPTGLYIVKAKKEGRSIVRRLMVVK